jgi:hypothetical protein
VIDKTASALTIVDPATARITSSVPLAYSACRVHERALSDVHHRDADRGLHSESDGPARRDACSVDPHPARTGGSRDRRDARPCVHELVQG